MRRKTGFYSIILTSVVCMLGCSAFAASSVRVLGAGGKTVVGATTGAGANNMDSAGAQSGAGISTSAVTSRASSLRFPQTPPSGTTSSTASQSYSGLVSNNGTARATVPGSSVVNPSNAASARLSIGKYLNLSHVNTTPTSSTGTGTSVTPSVEVDALRAELDNLKNKVDTLDLLRDTKQNTLIIGDGSYIDIAGPGNNVISIDIDALKSDLQSALGTDKAILIETDDNHDVWWCYANDAKKACDGDKQLVVGLGKVLEEYDLASGNSSIQDSIQDLQEALAGKQGKLFAADNGYIAINQEAGTIGVKYDELKNALGISDAKQSEIRFEDGKLQWRYTDEFENEIDPETGNQIQMWHTADIAGLLQQSLDNYVQTATLQDYVKRSELGGFQGALVPAENGYIEIENNIIGVKFADLLNDLNIPDAQAKVEIEITEDGILRWRYTDEFETNPETGDKTEKWTVVSGIDGLIDGKLASYVDNNSLTNVLKDYIAKSGLSDELQDYATKTYVDEGLATKQAKLTATEDGFIAITPVQGVGNVIDIKYNDLKTALGIDSLRTSAIRVENGVLQWRYTDEFETDPETGDKTEKWTNVFDLKSLLDDYVKKSDFNEVVAQIDTALDGKQIKLTPAEGGYIMLNEQTGEIAVDMYNLRAQLALETDTARTSELRVFDGELQWRYTDEYTSDDIENREEVWHSLDLSTLDLPYVKKSYLAANYYNKTSIDALAKTIENNINATLERLALPEDGPADPGLYLLTVNQDGEGEKVSNWMAVSIVDADGEVIDSF